MSLFDPVSEKSRFTRRLFVFFVYAAAGFYCLAIGAEQAPNFLWARHAGGTSQGVATGVAVDEDGSVYAVGQFQSIASFGSTNLSSRGITDIFLAKYDGAGNLLWLRQAGGTNWDFATGIAVDHSSNCYVAGYFTSTTTFGNSNFSAGGYDAGFVAKCNADGDILWVRKVGGSLGVQIHAIAVDRGGNPIVTGWFQGTATFGSVNLTASGYADIFVAKYDSTGNVTWAKKAGASSFRFDEGRAIAVDAAGDIYVTGNFEATTTFGNFSLTTAGPNGWRDIFLAKYDGAGNVIWAKSAGGTTDQDFSKSIAVDSTGNAYVTGQFKGAPAFGATNLLSSSLDIFVAKYDATGNLIWVRQAGGPLDGDNPTSITTDESDNCYVTGNFSGTAVFGPTNLSSRGSSDLFLAKYERDGNCLWAKQTGGSLSDWGSSVTSDIAGNIYLAGSFSGVVAFGNTNLTAFGNGDMFVSKLGFFQVTANGRGGAGISFTNVTFVRVEIISTIPNGTIFYTLDGTVPDFSSSQYTAPFVVSESVILRVIGYDAAFQSYSAGPTPITLPRAYALTVDTVGGGTIAVHPPAPLYLSDTIVTLTAAPDPGWVFLTWMGDGTGTNSVVNVVMSAKKSVQAVFGTSINTTVTGNGIVAFQPTQGPYPYGYEVRLNALPQPGFFFALWGNAASGNINPLTFVVTNPLPVVSCLFASLNTNQVALAVNIDGSGRVGISPRQNVYTIGQPVALTAIPDDGDSFTHWSGDATGTNNPLVVVMDESKVVTANFTRHPSLRVSTSLEGLVEDGFRLTVIGEFGEQYQILASTNLSIWTPVGAVTNRFGTVQFTDPTVTNFPHRFYRAATIGQ